MPAMHKGCVRLKDTVVAPGTELFAAMEAKDRHKVAALYNEGERTLARLECRMSYFALDGTLMVTATGNRSIFDDVDA